MSLTHLSLFSGIGGIDLAAEWAGFTTVGFVEKDPFCQKVLAKHWPGVAIHGDIRTFKWPMAYAAWDVQPEQAKGGTIGERTWECGQQRLTLLSGGFPCQPFSVAGQRGGTGDERHLWPEMLRVIREAQPLWVLGENVRGLLSIDGGRTFGTIVNDLAEVGYRVGWAVYGAAHVGAPHRRERVFIVAHATGIGRATRGTGDESEGSGRQESDASGGNSNVSNAQGFPEWAGLCEGRKGGIRGRRFGDVCCASDVAHTVSHGVRWPNGISRGSGEQEETTGDSGRGNWQKDGFGRAQSSLGWQAHGIPGWMARTWRNGTWEDGIPRVATGVPNRVERLRSLGNAVVPQQIYPILQAIADTMGKC